MTEPFLFAPLTLRGLTVRNRIAISPMCQYSAIDGFAGDWHLVHLGKLAQGGAGVVFAEATAVDPRGRITHGDLGIWDDAQVPALRRIADFVRGQGAVPAIQLAHAGRKASMQRPWHGNGPLTSDDIARGDRPWPTMAASAIALDEGWIVPSEMTAADLAVMRRSWAEATHRAADAGFDIVEIHGAHGYLLHTFLSPLLNRRLDAYGGDREGRMRFPLEIVEVVRAAWPANRPVFVRVSSVDGVDGGWSIEDTVVYARALKERGIDVLDCSSGGLYGSATASRSMPRGFGFQVPYAGRVRRDVGLTTMAVGLILDPAQAEAVIQSGQADIVAIGREALHNPNWPAHTAIALGAKGYGASEWPVQYGWWLERRERVLEAIRQPVAVQ